MAFFIPRNNVWFSFWVPVSPVYRYALTTITILCMVGAWYGLLYRTTEKRINVYSSYSSSVEQQQAQMHAAQQKQKRLQQKMLVAQQTFERALPTSEDQSTEQLAAVIRQAHTSGVNFNACTFCDEDDQQWCAKQSTACSFSGNLYQLLHFFDAVRSAGNMVQCTKLSMNTSAENKFMVQCALDFFAIKSPST